MTTVTGFCRPAQKRADVLAGAGGYIGNTVNLQRGQTRNFCDNLGRDL